MDALKLYDDVASECAKRTTKAYSTSFSLGIRFLAPSLREAIYNIYGFVRYADEIVDTLHGPQQVLVCAFQRRHVLGARPRDEQQPHFACV